MGREAQSGRPNERRMVLRRAILGGGLLLCYGALFFRLAWVQCFQHEAWSSLAAASQTRRVPRPARRGHILDRRGRELAITRSVESCCANPRAIKAKKQTARILSRLLNLDQPRLLEQLSRERYFIWVKRKLTRKEAELVRRFDLRGVGLRTEQQRFYPNARLACHVLGFVDIDGKGLAGEELAFDRWLAGKPGCAIMRQDACRRTIRTAGEEERPARPGLSLVLTIDATIQQALQEELAAACERWKPKWASGVVLCPRTGDVLAMANVPDFNPNEFWRFDEEQRRNRAVTDSFEPGSAFKPFVAAWALQRGQVELGSRFDCRQGIYRVGRRVLRDAHAYGVLDLKDVLVHSSNIGIAQVAARLGDRDLYQAVRAFGFGQRTGIALPGEASGILNPVGRWSSYSQASIAMGQEVAVTPLQLAVGFATLANGGYRVRPRIALGLASPDGLRIVRRFPAPPRERVLSREVAEWMGQAVLREVVTRGTGRRARGIAYAVAGKTGTAQVAAPNGGGYIPDAYVGTFVGFAPAGAPRVVVAISVGEPKGVHYGGRVAAPAVAKVIERSLSYYGVSARAGEPKRVSRPLDSNGRRPRLIGLGVDRGGQTSQKIMALKPRSPRARSAQVACP